MNEQLSESNAKLSDYTATVAALESTQTKMQSENSDLSQQLAEAESKAGSLSKVKSSLEAQLEELRSELQTESSVSVFFRPRAVEYITLFVFCGHPWDRRKCHDLQRGVLIPAIVKYNCLNSTQHGIWVSSKTVFRDALISVCPLYIAH